MRDTQAYTHHQLEVVDLALAGESRALLELRRAMRLQASRDARPDRMRDHDFPVLEVLGALGVWAVMTTTAETPGASGADVLAAGQEAADGMSGGHPLMVRGGHMAVRELERALRG